MKSFEGYRKRAKQFLHTPGERHMVAAAAVLGISTALWSLTIARLQLNNADQLADGFLFTDGKTFRQAQFPLAHTQLLKWPLFWMLAKLHNAPGAYMATTVGLCLLTVGATAYIVFRIVRRPAMVGTLYLALACILTLVPAQVLGGVGSPLSMAMVTGRNIEYLLYIAALAFLLPVKKDYGWYRLGIAATLFGLLFASDQLFLLCSAGGAAGLLLYVYGWKKYALKLLAVRWSVATGAGWVLASLALWVMGYFTEIAGKPADFTGLVASFTDMKHGAAAALKGVLLNFGISAQAGWWVVLPVLLNSVLLGLVIYASYTIWRKMLRSSAEPDNPTLLSLLLGLSAVAVFIIYALANHQAVTDARYLTIMLFAGYITLAVFMRSMRVSDHLLYTTGVILGAGVVFGSLGVVHHANRLIAKDPVLARTTQIVSILSQRHEQILVGDFWRVLPIKEQTKQTSQQVLPLSGCMRPRQILTSAAWRQDLYTHSFAYLLPVQDTGVSFGRCSLRTAIMLYGQPSEVVRIGNRQSPLELLLLYNDGAARIRGNRPGVPTPVFGVPTEGTARPTGSTIVPLADPS